MMSIRIRKVTFLIALAAMFMAAVLAVGMIAFVPAPAKADSNAVASYDQKLIARYSLDSVETDESTNYFAAVDASGAAVASLNATTTATSADLISGMEGSGGVTLGKKNLSVPGFLTGDNANATGFSFSTWLKNPGALPGGDWHAFLTSGQFKVTAGNLDPWGAYQGNLTPQGHMPAGSGGEYDSFINVLSGVDAVTANRGNDYFYMTITLDENGVRFYRNGILIIDYKPDVLFKNNGVSVNKTVEDFVTAVVTAAKSASNNFQFFSHDSATYSVDDLRISLPLTDAEVTAQATDALKVGLSEISYKAGSAEAETLKSFDYDKNIAGIEYSSNEYNIVYFASNNQDDANKPTVTLTPAAMNPKTKQLDAYADGDNTVAVSVGAASGAEETPNVKVNYYHIYTLTAGSFKKDFKITFDRVFDANSKKMLSAIRVNDTLIDGFAVGKTNFTYTIPASESSVPTVTATPLALDAVEIVTNAASAAQWDGKTFEYKIEVYAKNAEKIPANVLETYTIDFTRESSAFIASAAFKGNNVKKLNTTTFYDADANTGAQKVHVNSYFAQGDTSNIGFSFTTTELVSVTVGDKNNDKRIIVTIKDNVSNETAIYAFDQVLFNAEQDILYKVDFENDTIENTDSVYTFKDKSFTLNGSAAIGDSGLSLGATGYVNFAAGIFSGADNADGITISTWFKQAKNSASDYAGVLSLNGATGSLVANKAGWFTGGIGPKGKLPEGSSLAGDWLHHYSADANPFVAEDYMLVTIVISDYRLEYYVNGTLKESFENFKFRFSAGSALDLGMSRAVGELLGTGDYKDLVIYNKPLSEETMFAIMAERSNAKLSSLKLDGVSITGFSPDKFSYDIKMSSDNASPTISDFPTLTATNGGGNIAASSIVKSAVSNKSVTYTITSAVGGHTYTYTVKVTLVKSDAMPESVSIKSGLDIDDTISMDDFTLNDNGVYEYTYTYAKGINLSDIIVIFNIKDGQEVEDDGVISSDGKFRAYVYASDEETYNEFVITFVEKTDEGGSSSRGCGGCGGAIGASVTSFALTLLAVVVAAAVMLLVLKKKKNAK